MATTLRLEDHASSPAPQLLLIADAFDRPRVSKGRSCSFDCRRVSVEPQSLDSRWAKYGC